jgi:hypothetical protein
MVNVDDKVSCGIVLVTPKSRDGQGCASLVVCSLHRKISQKNGITKDPKKDLSLVAFHCICENPDFLLIN